ncbi:MAG TPA: hypothetical protein ENK68_02425 [Epsilonproteobacteria bacterium]|nr:hypothetical protein [Campylobacterota bacterium]
MFIINRGIVILLFSAFLYAESTENQFQLLKASQNIRIASQKIAKNYLYYYANPKKTRFKDLAETELKDLDKEYKAISGSTNNEESKDILTFLDYSRETMEEVFNDPFSKDNPPLMLDYSEVILEGAESINNNIKYVPSVKEGVLIKIHDISFLIERLTKYYMAILIDNSAINYTEILNDAIKKIEDSLSLISKHNYNCKTIALLTKVKNDWQILKKYYIQYNEMKIQHIILLASSKVEKDISSLSASIEDDQKIEKK